MLKKKNIPLRALPFVLWTGIIFSFSAGSAEQSGLASSEFTHGFLNFLTQIGLIRACDYSDSKVSSIELFLRKFAHFAEFFILGLLLAFFLYTLIKSKFFSFRSKKTLWVLAAAYILLIALIDEGIQFFVPGRGPAFTDILIDLAGGLAALLLAAYFLSRKKHSNKEIAQEEDLGRS